MRMISFSYAKAREDLTQQVIRRKLSRDRAELALRQAKLFREKFALRHCLSGPLERLGDSLKGDEVPLTRHEHIFSPRLPASQSKQRFADALDAVAGLGRDVNAPALFVLLRPRRIAGKIDFIEHRYRLQFPRQPVDDSPVGCGDTSTRVHDKKQRIGVSDHLPGARDADCLDLVGSVSQTGSIDDIHGHALNLDGLTHCVPRGAGNFSDDGKVLSGEPVEERRFPYVRLASQYDLEPAAKDTALTAAGKRAANLFLQVPQAPVGVLSVYLVDFLLGKVQGRFHQRAQLDEPLRKGSDDLREFPAQRAQRAPRRSLGSGVDKVGHALGLREIELVIQEGASGEFPGLGEARAKLQASPQDHLQHHGPSVTLQLEHVFAGIGRRCSKEKRDAVVDRLAGGAAEDRAHGQSRRRYTAEQARRELLELLSGDAN